MLRGNQGGWTFSLFKQFLLQKTFKESKLFLWCFQTAIWLSPATRDWVKNKAGGPDRSGWDCNAAFEVCKEQHKNSPKAWNPCGAGKSFSHWCVKSILPSNFVSFNISFSSLHWGVNLPLQLLLHCPKAIAIRNVHLPSLSNHTARMLLFVCPIY